MKLKFKNTTTGQMAAEAVADFAGPGVGIDEIGLHGKWDLLHDAAENDEKEVLVSIIIAMLPRELRLAAADAYNFACATRR